MSEMMNGTKVLGILGFGTDAGEQNGYVEIVAQDRSTAVIAFDIDMADHLAVAFLQAAAHLRYKQQLRLTPGDTLVPGQPVPIISGHAMPVTAGPETMILLTLTTAQRLELRFAMAPRAAAVFAKRLSKKMAPMTQPTSRNQ